MCLYVFIKFEHFKNCPIKEPGLNINDIHMRDMN